MDAKTSDKKSFDKKTFDKSRLPSRHVTEGPERAPHRSYYYAMGLTREQGMRLRDTARVLHDDQTSWSRQGRHEVVPDAGHYIQFDRPDVVVRATREVVDAVRAGGTRR